MSFICCPNPWWIFLHFSHTSIFFRLFLPPFFTLQFFRSSFSPHFSHVFRLVKILVQFPNFSILSSFLPLTYSTPSPLSLSLFTQNTTSQPHKISQPLSLFFSLFCSLSHKTPLTPTFLLLSISHISSPFLYLLFANKIPKSLLVPPISSLLSYNPAIRS